MNGKEVVWKKAEEFRASHLIEKLAFLPLDVFSLAELSLRLDVLLMDDLAVKHSVDAAITKDFTGIYVDAESYIVWDKGLPKWKENRLRFSVAHELGHFILHKEAASAQNFSTFEEFREWLYSNKYSFEQEANEFAGRLLVPVEKLASLYEQFSCAIKGTVPNWRQLPDLRGSFSEKIASKFGVNHQVIGVRLDREEIWPEPY